MSKRAHEERLMTVIRGPHLSEKAHVVAESNQVVFKVRTDANKLEIRKAVEMMFEVKVDNVTVMNYAGKMKRQGQNYGQRAAWKKAYVTLAPGSQIEFLGGE